jgi:tetratricopeptide (TPR) repeat protein
VRKRKLYYISFGFFLIVIFAIPLVAFLLPKGKAVYYLAVSLTLLQEGDTAGAIAQAEKAVELRPESVITLRGLARAYVEAGEYDDRAAEVVEKLVTIAPELAEGHYYLGVVRFYRSDPEGARAAAQKAISLAPDFPGGYLLLGVMALEENELEAAETHLAKAAEIDPENWRTNYLLGLVFYEKKDYFQAIEYFKHAVRLRPEYAPGHAVLAICYLYEKLYIHALSEFMTAVDLDPADHNSMYNIACIYSLQNKPEPALRWLERALDNGFSDFEHMKQDPDLDNIRESSEYREMIEAATREAPADEEADEKGAAPLLEEERRGNGGSTLSESAADVRR